MSKISLAVLVLFGFVFFFQTGTYALSLKDVSFSHSFDEGFEADRGRGGDKVIRVIGKPLRKPHLSCYYHHYNYQKILVIESRKWYRVQIHIPDVAQKTFNIEVWGKEKEKITRLASVQNIKTMFGNDMKNMGSLRLGAPRMAEKPYYLDNILVERK